jgi:protein phosphatase
MKRSPACVISEVGRRDTNQDRACAVTTSVRGEPALLMAVADGMGGMTAGDKAAEAAIDTVREYGRDVFPALGTTAATTAVTAALERMFQDANRRIWERGQQRGIAGDIGTTLVCCLLIGKRFLVANAGDSRCYYVNDHEVRQVTVDHSQVQDMIRRGVMTPEAASRSPFRNQLTNCLGEPHDITVDIFPSREKYGVVDEACVLMLLTDGVHGHVSERELLEEVSNPPTLSESCSNLIALALKHGSTDNVTVVAVENGRLRSRRQVRLNVPTPDTIRGPDTVRGPVTVKLVRRPIQRRRRWTRAALVTAAALLLLAGAGAGYWWFPQSWASAIWNIPGRVISGVSSARPVKPTATVPRTSTETGSPVPGQVPSAPAPTSAAADASGAPPPDTTSATLPAPAEPATTLGARPGGQAGAAQSVASRTPKEALPPGPPPSDALRQVPAPDWTAHTSCRSTRSIVTCRWSPLSDRAGVEYRLEIGSGPDIGDARYRSPWSRRTSFSGNPALRGVVWARIVARTGEGRKLSEVIKLTIPGPLSDLER